MEDVKLSAVFVTISKLKEISNNQSIKLKELSNNHS